MYLFSLCFGRCDYYYCRYRCRSDLIIFFFLYRMVKDLSYLWWWFIFLVPWQIWQLILGWWLSNFLILFSKIAQIHFPCMLKRYQSFPHFFVVERSGVIHVNHVMLLSLLVSYLSRELLLLMKLGRSKLKQNPLFDVVLVSIVNKFIAASVRCACFYCVMSQIWDEIDVKIALAEIPCILLV